MPKAKTRLSPLVALADAQARGARKHLEQQ